MRANDIFNIKINIGEDLCMITGRILYWWEEQNIKTDSLYEETSTNKLVLEHSKIFIKTMNKFLLSVESNGKKITKETLHELSLEKNRDMEWADVLHHSVVIPLYEAYIEVSGSSMNKMKSFRQKVIAAYDKTLRAEQFEDFPLPAELIEYDFLSTNGVLTRTDLLNMSYAEILKYQTIREIDKRYKGGTSGASSFNPDKFTGQANQASNDQIHQLAKQYFPESTT